jgi:hypothetical protein
MHHVYLMTHQIYRDMLIIVRQEIASNKKQLSLMSDREWMLYAGEAGHNNYKLRSYRAKLVAWWHGSRIGNPPPFPDLA